MIVGARCLHRRRVRPRGRRSSFWAARRGSMRPAIRRTPPRSSSPIELAALLGYRRRGSRGRQRRRLRGRDRRALPRLRRRARANEGAAFVFLGSASGIADGNPCTADSQLESNQATRRSVSSVAGAGDVNGDGYADVIVGASYDAGESGRRARRSCSWAARRGSSPTAIRARRTRSSSPISRARRSVFERGGGRGRQRRRLRGRDRRALLYDAGESDEGAAFVFLGGASGIVAGQPRATAATRSSSRTRRARQLGTERSGGRGRQRRRLRRRDRRSHRLRRGRGRRGRRVRVPRRRHRASRAAIPLTAASQLEGEPGGGAAWAGASPGPGTSTATATPT